MGGRWFEEDRGRAQDISLSQPFDLGLGAQSVTGPQHASA
jgi:hypothetical protein